MLSRQQEYGGIRKGYRLVNAGTLRNVYNVGKSLGRMASNAYSSYNRGAPKLTEVKDAVTQTRRLSKKRATGTYSKSAGRLKTRRLSKKYKKRNAMVVNGVTRVIEAGGVIGGTAVSEIETAWIGHATPVYQLKYCMWWAALRQLLVKVGASVESLAFNTVIGGVAPGVVGTVTGDAFSVTLKATETAGVTTQTFTLVNTSTVSDVVTFFAETSANLQTDTVNCLEMYFTPALGSVFARNKIRLQTSFVKVMMKSDLKIQNRTVIGTATNDDVADDVANQPLYGKSYEGPGLGPVYKSINGGGSFSANASTGVCTFIIGAPSANNEYSEPLEYQKFEKVSKAGKVHLDPGQIKTSTITKTFTANFNYLLTQLNPQASQASTATGPRSQLNGKFSTYRMFALEKMLDSQTALTSTQPIVAYEVNSKVMMSFQERRSQPTAQDFIKFRP